MTDEILHKKQKLFIKRAKKKFKKSFDYSKFVYKGSRVPSTIICKIHGEFEQSPRLHLQSKHGCPECGNKAVSDYRKSLTDGEELRNKIFPIESVSGYFDWSNPMLFRCTCGEEFSTHLTNVIKGSFCKSCGLKKMGESHKISEEDFIERANSIHNNQYTYLDYKMVTEPVKIRCKIHGEFTQLGYSHLKGAGCPKCSYIESNQEKEVHSFFKDMGIKTLTNDRTFLENKELDILIPNFKLAVEFDGLYWHSDKFIQKEYHILKTEECEEKGVQLVHIFEDEWKYKNDIVKSRLTNLLGKTPRKIYGRDTCIREVDTTKSMEFLEENHIQGKLGGKVKLGLYLEDELVSIMTFGSLRKSLGSTSKDGSYELLRFCNKKYTNVIGGASKLFKYFLQTYKPNYVIAYADRRWSKGELYVKLGFTFVKNTIPNYFYVKSGNRYNRFRFRKSELIKQGFDPSKTEREIMQDLGYLRIYDCGTKKFEYKYNND